MLIAYARVLTWNGRQAAALQIYEQHLRDAPHLGRVEERLVAELLMELDRPADAIGLYQSLAARGAEDAPLTAGLLLAHARLGDQTGALDAAARLAAMPGFLTADKTTLADTLYREDRTRLALLIYQQIYATDTTNLDIAAKLVRTHVRLFDLPAASAILQSHAGAAEDVRMRLADANYRTVVGEHAGAYAIYRSLLDELPTNSSDAIQAIEGNGHVAPRDG